MNEQYDDVPAETSPPVARGKCPSCGARAVETSASGLYWCGSCGEELHAASIQQADAEDAETVPKSAMILAGLILGGIFGAISGIFLGLPELPAGITGGILGAIVGACSRGQA